MSALAIGHDFGREGVFAHLRNAWANWKLRRETRLALNDLSERNLDDIGMNRADIDTVIARI